MKKALILALSAILLMMQSSNIVFAASEAAAMRVEAEWCTDTNFPDDEGDRENGLPVMRNDVFSNGLAIGFSTAKPIPQEGYYMNFPVDVASNGYYDMEFMSSTLGSDWTSKFTVSVNNSDDLQIADFSGSRIGNGPDPNWGKYSMRIYLNQGENNILFRIKERPKLNQNSIMWFFDYFELKLSENQSVFAECEQFFGRNDNEVKFALDNSPGSQFSQDKFLTIGGNYNPAMNNKEAQLYVYAHEAGTYSLKTSTTVLGVDYTGTWSLKNESGEKIDVNTETSEFVSDVTGFGNVFKVYNVNGKIHLDEGYNVLTISANKLPKENRFTTYVDYLQFTKVENKASDIIIEAESIPDHQYWQKAGSLLRLAEGKDYKWANIILEDEFRISYDFNVEVADTYNLIMTMGAANGSSIMFSPMEMKLDDGNWILFDNNNYVFDSQIGKEDPNFNPTYNQANYRVTTPFELSKGTHTISFRIRERRTNMYEDWYFSEFDKFCFKTDRTFANLSATTAKSILKNGETTDITVKAFDNAGKQIDVMPEFYSDNEKIATVDENGTIYAHNNGSANITVSAESEGVTKESVITVTVLSDYLGVKIYNAELVNNVVRVKLSNPINTGKPCSIIVTQSDMQENYKTSLKAVEEKVILSENKGKVTNDELHGILPVWIEIPLKTQSDVVSVYFWDDTESMTPVANMMNIEK